MPLPLSEQVTKLEQNSKLPKLKENLLNAPNLRSLDIKFKYNWMPPEVTWLGITATPRLLNLPLNSTDRLPTLQELTFSGPPETYEFDRPRCQLLRRAWTGASFAASI